MHKVVIHSKTVTIVMMSAALEQKKFARNKQSLQIDGTVSVPSDVEMSSRKQVGSSVDSDIVDLVEKMRKEEQEEETSMNNDAVTAFTNANTSALRGGRTFCSSALGFKSRIGRRLIS